MNARPDSSVAPVTQLFDNLLSGYLTIAGTGLLVAGCILFLRRAHLWLTGERADGEVIGYKARMKQTRGEVVSHMPLVRFTASDGVMREFQSRTSAQQSRSPVGTIVPVRYSAQRPERAEIASPFHYWIAPGGLLLFGLLLLLAAFRAAN